MNDKVHIALAADEKYLPGLEVTQASMLRSCAHPERLEFHVFRETPELAERIRREFGDWKGSVMTFVRLYLVELLPQADLVVYSDVDTIWNRDVCELYDLVAHATDSSAENRMVYWVRDGLCTRRETAVWQKRVNPDFDVNRYACAGVSVLNLKKMRETNFLQRAVEFTQRYGRFKYADQDVLNALCNQDSGLLPVCWDVVGNWEELPPDSRCVYHITGVGRVFNAQEPSVYPPQYQLWWNVRTGAKEIHPRSRLLAKLWPLRFLTALLPCAIRAHVFRQLYFSKELQKMVDGKCLA